MTTPAPFEMLGQQHLWTVLIIIAAAVILPLTIKRMVSQSFARRFGILLGIALLALKIIEPIYMMTNGKHWVDVLPLHLCDIGAVVTAIMLINRNYFFYELTYFWGFGGTLQAIITPSLNNGFPHIDFWLYFVSHGLIIVGVIYAMVLYAFRPTLKSILRAFTATAVLAVIIAPINWILNTNYMYLCDKPPTASLYDYLGPWPWYILSLAPVALFFFFLYYSPFWIADLVRSRKKN